MISGFDRIRPRWLARALRRPRLRIRTKLFIMTTLLVGAISSFIYLFFPSKLEDQAVRALVAKARSIAEMTAFSISPSLYFDDEITTQEVFASALQNPDLVYIYVTGTSGTVIASAPGAALEGPFSIPPPASWNHVGPDAGVYHATTPIRYREAEMGTLHLALSLESVQRQVRASRQATAIVSIGILILGTMAAFALSTTVVGPLSSMANTVELIAKGDLERRAEVVTNDEIGDLANSFNTMVGTLQLAQEQLEELNRALEHRVADRTQALLEEIEERKRIETALRSSEDRLHKVVQHLPEGVLLLDAALVVLLANPAAAELTGPAGLAAPGERLDAVAGMPLSRIAAAGSWVEVITAETPRRVLEVTVRELGGSDARGGRIVVLRDVTRERDVQEQLRQSDRLASLGQLASGIAHDFRNILQGIMMSAELMLVDARMSPSEEEELESILKHGRRGASLITQILDFSRRSTSSHSHLDMAQLLGTAVPMLRRLIPEAVKIDLELPDEPLVVLGDATQLQQIVVNLALNARDAMPSGGTLEIRLSRVPPASAGTPCSNEPSRQAEPAEVGALGLEPEQPAAGSVSRICLEVRDNGEGIPKAARDHVFEPFFTTKPPGSGTGLGLSQVYGIVHKHGGQVLFDSHEGLGTTFRVLLPEVAPATARRDLAQHTDDLPEGSGQKILLVEDEASLRRSLRKGLETLGYTVLEATDGVEALDIWHQRRHEVALVLSDVIMPVMGGIELVRRLGQEKPPVEIVLMSGHPLDTDDHASILRLGIQLIEKPVPLDTLARALDSALGRNISG